MLALRIATCFILLFLAFKSFPIEFLEDKWLKVAIKDLNLAWYISYQDEKLVVAEKPVQEDVSF
ncbi:hypothetical protein BTM22_25945, partial [Vibrio parahaemolyticus]